MKGLVLAGGAGTRLRPLTYTGAKQLVPVANRPILFYVLDNLVNADIRDIGIVISPETGAEVRSAVGTGVAWNARIEYILQQRPAGLAHAVRTARPYLGTDDFCMFLGDNLVGSMIKDSVAEFAKRTTLSASVMLKEVPNPSSFGIAEVDAEGNVVALIEKPNDPKSNLALVGIYLFRRGIFDAIERLKPSARGELEITDAISMLIAMGGVVRFERIVSWWLDTGKKDDLLLANDTVLDTWLTGDISGTVDATSTISGRVRVESGAIVTRSTIRGPAIIGAGAVIVDSRIGSFTSLGARVHVERSGIGRSVIMEDSKILDIPHIEDSILGRRVIARPGTSHVHALSLLLGDDCRVELSQ